MAIKTSMQLRLHTHTLKLKHPFTISRASRTTQASLIVELSDGTHRGFGETTSNPYYDTRIEAIETIIRKHEAYICSLFGERPEVFWKTLFPLFQHNVFALCALDVAYHDLYARRQGKKLYDCWGLSIENNPKTNYTIGIDSIENMVLKMKEVPWPIYKIKLGTPEDIAIVRELRKHSNAVFRIDANCGWTLPEAIENAHKLKALGVEFLEQPLPAEAIDDAKILYRASALPIIADESCIVEADVEKCVGLFHGINVKLSKCGGLTPGKRMLENAKKLGLQTMVGCMTESTVGISAIAHLLPLLDFVDMDGALLLKEDIASGVTIQDGIISYAKGSGTGAHLL